VCNGSATYRCIHAAKTGNASATCGPGSNSARPAALIARCCAQTIWLEGSSCAVVLQLAAASFFAIQKGTYARAGYACVSADLQQTYQTFRRFGSCTSWDAAYFVSLIYCHVQLSREDVSTLIRHGNTAATRWGGKADTGPDGHERGADVNGQSKPTIPRRG